MRPCLRCSQNMPVTLNQFDKCSLGFIPSTILIIKETKRPKPLSSRDYKHTYPLLCLLGCGRELNVAVNDGFRRKPPEMRSLWYCKVKLEPSPKAHGTGFAGFLVSLLTLPGAGSREKAPKVTSQSRHRGRQRASDWVFLRPTHGDPRRLKTAEERSISHCCHLNYPKTRAGLRHYPSLGKETSPFVTTL